ncbi:2-acylglycerol O-acyltransferase 2-like [Xenia sp. Carnegie-2017]|uniref:2-acylglycerol O-acyltransferase 2-like n=1 Tax=Xenia sp. Carnegie-2017 TaxID=2897299 RepID=UPI001F039BD9|nr:2-acylglycerol O-acyltransferase 2-like [Xenia sp. Carnegie-2017]
MAKAFGIEWAPLKIPVKRRRQTFLVWIVGSTFMFGHIFCVLVCLFLLYINLFTRIFLLLYLAWIYMIDKDTPHRGGRYFPAMRRLKVWNYCAEYFPLRLIKTHELDESKNYLFGCHPHGVMAVGSTGNFASEATGFSKHFPGLTVHLITLNIQFKIPFLREFLLAMGICPASRESLKHILTKMGPGHSCVVVVGGASEALEARPGNYTLVLKNRKGFVKIALKTGASLVPVFCFGENDLFKQYPNPEGSYLRKIQTKVKDIATFSPPLFYGRGIFQYTFGLVPFRKPVHTIVGRPIHIVANTDPSIEDIENLHQRYLEGLKEIFEEYKEKFGIDKDKHLEFI